MARQNDTVGGVSVRSGRIRDVHPATWTVDVEFENGGHLSSIDLLSPYAHPERAEGVNIFPEIGAQCVVMTHMGEGFRPCVLGYRHLRAGDREDKPADHSAGRGPAVPGDMEIRSRDGNFVRVLRGGMVEIGADQATRTWYFPTKSVIRHLCENLETFVSGSRFSVKTIDDPTIPDEDVDDYSPPIQLSMFLQEYTDKPPIIDLKMGHVVGDENRRLADAEPGEIVGRLLIFDQATADWAETVGVEPSPDSAVTQLRYDRRGNVEQIYAGRYAITANGRRLTLTNNDVVTVGGNRSETITGSQTTSVGTKYHLSSKGDMTLRTRGRLTLACRELELVERASRVNTVEGSRIVNVGGQSEDHVAGDRRETAGAANERTALTNVVENVGGKYVRTVLHTAELASSLQDAIADLVAVMDGKLRRHAKQGSIELMVGPESAPTRLKLHNDPTVPHEIGRVSITWPNGSAVIFDQLKGQVAIQTPTGEIVMSPDGSTQVGLKGAPAGNVLTTLTHPVCLLTGAPIMGCTGLKAAGIPMPGPATPSVPVLPNVDKPDVPRP